MSLREKLKRVLPDGFSGKACFSALRRLWLQINPQDPASPFQSDEFSLARTFDRRDNSPEIRGLLEALQTIRKRILANVILRSWTKWFIWLLAALILLAAVRSRLAGALLLVALVGAVGAGAILAWAWRNRPSHYETARCLDSAARLQDRLSTAVFLGDGADRVGMIGEQRHDALAHLEKLDPQKFFAVQWPGNFKRASVLVLLAAGLLAYRVHHRPPLLSLLQTTAHSQLVQSIFAPVAHAVEKDLQRTMALVTAKPDAMGAETRRDAVSNAEDLWKTNEEPGADDQKNTPNADPGDEQDQLQAPGDEEGSPNSDTRPNDRYSQSQEGKSGNDSEQSKAQEQSEQQGPEGRQSLGQSIMQALKNMMSNSPNQTSNNRASRQQNGQGTPQSGNSQQPGDTESDKRGDSRGNSDAKQKATQTASEGAGSQEGSKELRKDQQATPINAVPDRVALEASGFKEQTRMKVPTETGTAQLAVRDLSPRQDAVTNGAEQENIPARYRFYVQRYFDHADNGKH